MDQSPVLINSEKGQYETIIHKYTSNGNPIKTWNTNSSGGGIATDLYGNVYALSAPQVKVFTTNGSLIRVWNSGDFYARNIATDSSGTVYTLGENVSKLTNEGTLLTRWHISGDGMGIAGGPYNSIYILARHHSFLYSIEKFTNSGQLIATWNKTKGTTDGQLSDDVRDIAVDSSGNVYVADTGNNRIQKFDDNGKFITKFGSFGSNDGELYLKPLGISVDSARNVYVVDWGNKRIQVFAPKG